MYIDMARCSAQRATHHVTAEVALRLPLHCTHVMLFG
jgi:hypothetical protein